MNVYQVTIANYSSIADEKASELFDEFLLPNQVFATLEGAKAYCEADFKEHVTDYEMDPSLTLEWEPHDEDAWVGSCPDLAEDEDATVYQIHLMEVRG